MVHRKVQHNKSNEMSSHDASLQLAFNYVRDFSQQATQYRQHKSDKSLSLLNRCASLLSTTIQPQHMNPTQLEMSKFFIDLHAVMNSLAIDSDALWSCLALLQHCTRNLTTRQAIVEDYRFVPLLAFLLKRTQAQDKVERILVLLQELSYGIHITWEEPYLVVLMEQLVDIVYSSTEEDEEAHAQLALSILINLCYKNFVVLFLFRRSVNISSFSRKIQKYGMLANKMLILLSEDMYSPDQKQLHTFIRSTLASIDECIKEWHVPHMRHIVDFLLDAKSHTGLHLAMCNYEHYCEDVKHLLDQLEARSGMDDANEDTRKTQHLCMSLLFKLINYILELSSIAPSDGGENIISLDSIVPRIYEWLSNWVESDVCGVDAINLLETLLRLGKRETLSPRIARDPSLVVQLIGISEQSETSSQHTSAILQLLITLLHQTKTEKLILSKISESYFDKIFAPLLQVKTELLNSSGLELCDIEKSLYCLLLLISFAEIAKKAYFEKCCNLLQQEQIQYAMARAMCSGGERVCAAVFQISQFEHFPQAQVAKHIASINAGTTSSTLANAAPQQSEQWRNFNVILKSHETFVSKDLEERLSALIELISNAQANNQLQNVATSQIIELFNYKLEKFSNVEQNMRLRLDAASNEITHLTQRVNLQNAELEKHQTMNFELHIQQEGLQTQCKDLKQQKDNLKRHLTDVMNKLAEQSEALKINEKRLHVKLSEIMVLQKDCNELKVELKTKTEELDKLQAMTKENITRIDKLKKTIAAYELDIKDRVRSLEEKERELLKTQKALEEQKDAKKKADGVIAVLETQLQDKSEQLRICEQELSDTEEMRKTIMSLMESKKPKRKA